MEFKNKLEKAGEDGTLYWKNAGGYTCENCKIIKKEIFYMKQFIKLVDERTMQSRILEVEGKNPISSTLHSEIKHIIEDFKVEFAEDHDYDPEIEDVAMEVCGYLNVNGYFSHFVREDMEFDF